MTLEQRIERLERENRLFRAGPYAILAVVALGAMLTPWAGAQAAAATNNSTDRLEPVGGAVDDAALATGAQAAASVVVVGGALRGRDDYQAALSSTLLKYTSPDRVPAASKQWLARNFGQSSDQVARDLQARVSEATPMRHGGVTGTTVAPRDRLEPVVRVGSTDCPAAPDDVSLAATDADLPAGSTALRNFSGGGLETIREADLPAQHGDGAVLPGTLSPHETEARPDSASASVPIAEVVLFGSGVDLNRALSQPGAAPNSVDDYGMTPLHWAAVLGDQEAAQLLVSAGADVEATNQAGLRPADIARRQRCAELGTWLERCRLSKKRPDRSEGNGSGSLRLKMAERLGKLQPKSMSDGARPLSRKLADLAPELAMLQDDSWEGGALGVMGFKWELSGTGELLVTDVLNDTPAKAAGIRAGWRITCVDGRPLQGLSLERVLCMTMKPIGSYVVLAGKGAKGERRETTVQYADPKWLAEHRAERFQERQEAEKQGFRAGLAAGALARGNTALARAAVGAPSETRQAPRRTIYSPPPVPSPDIVSTNRYDPNSLANPYGAGSPYKTDGLMNPYSQYGSPYSNKSWTNPYATDAPKLYDSQGKYLGKLSANKYDPESTSNPYGRYGSPYSTDSINNKYGPGNPYNPRPIYVVPSK